MILKYRAYIDGEFYYFDLYDILNIVPEMFTFKEEERIYNFLCQGNQPDIYIGYQDSSNVDIYTNDIVNMVDGLHRKKIIKYEFVSGFISNNDQVGYKSIILELTPSSKIIGNIHQNGDYLK